MPEHFKYFDRDQPLLFTSALGDLIPENHPVRFFIDAIEGLNIPIEKFHVNHFGCGEEQYPPVMMLTMMIYCFANRIFSYRDIEKATYNVLPVRFITGDLHPCFKTIGNFRKNNAEIFTEVFLNIVHIAKKSGLVTLGEVSLDSSQFKANASKDRNYNILTIEREKKECQQILDMLLAEEQKAQMEDKTPVETDLPDDFNTPQKRAQAIKKAKQQIANLEKAEEALDKRAEEEFNKEKENYNSKMAQRKAKEEQGQKVYGRTPQEPKKTYNVNWQANSTDPESRIMIHEAKRSPATQSYNVQTIVDNNSRMIVAGVVTNNASDGGQLYPMIKHLEETVGKPQTVLADQGYINSSQIQELKSSGKEVLIPVGGNFVVDKNANRIADQATNQSHESSDGIQLSEGNRLLTGQRKSKPQADTGGRKKAPYTDPCLVELQNQMQEEEYRKRYNKRSSTIEPVFGIIKNVYKFVQFRYRGLFNVQSEIMMVYTVYNLKRLFALGFNFKTAKR